MRCFSNISGIWDVDQARSVDLSRTALNIGREILRPGGRMLIKVFQGKLFQDFVGDVERSFSFTTISKPEASRKRSAETYVIGKGFSPD
ncbi:MAG: hypothetical protein KGY45_04695 [Hadesarchaea archaeon]|nr:hypothetical protein [Hadesarchaea archaeon]